MNEIKQSQPEFTLPKQEKLQQLRNSTSYKNIEKNRPKYKSYNLFSKEVDIHHEIVRNEEIQKNSKSRPITSKIKPPPPENQFKIVVKRPESSRFEKVNLI